MFRHILSPISLAACHEACDKKMATYAQELKAEFKDKHLITDMKTQIEQLTVKLEKVFSGKEELPLQEQELKAKQKKIMTKGLWAR